MHSSVIVHPADYGHWPRADYWHVSDAWLRFRDVDLGGGGSLQLDMRVSRWRPQNPEERFEVWIGGTVHDDQYQRDGLLAGYFDIDETGGFFTTAPLSLESTPSGIHNVYLVFPAGTSLQSFRLQGPGLANVRQGNE